MSDDVIIGAHFVLGHSNNMALKPNHLIETIHVQKNSSFFFQNFKFSKFKCHVTCMSRCVEREMFTRPRNPSFDQESTDQDQPNFENPGAERARTKKIFKN